VAGVILTPPPVPQSFIIMNVRAKRFSDWIELGASVEEAYNEARYGSAIHTPNVKLSPNALKNAEKSAFQRRPHSKAAMQNWLIRSNREAALWRQHVSREKKAGRAVRIARNLQAAKIRLRDSRQRRWKKNYLAQRQKKGLWSGWTKSKGFTKVNVNKWVAALRKGTKSWDDLSFESGYSGRVLKTFRAEVTKELRRRKDWSR